MRLKIYFSLIISITILLSVSHENVRAESASQTHKSKYDQLYEFLEINEKEFMDYWRYDKSIADIASNKGISEWELFKFLHKKEMVSDIQEFLLFIHETRTPLEKSYKEIGYTSIKDAINEFETHFNKSLQLPNKIPPLPFTIKMGRFSDSKGDINDKLNIEYINDRYPKNHYQIWVQPSEYGLDLKERHIDSTYTLKNGSTAVFSSKIFRGANLFLFDHNGWQYVLGVNKRVADKVTVDTLLDIANSIPSETERD